MWALLHYSVLPLAATAVALALALITLVGLVVKPLPWWPDPVFGAAPKPAVNRPATSVPPSPDHARRVVAASPTATPTAGLSPAGGGQPTSPPGSGSSVATQGLPQPSVSVPLVSLPGITLPTITLPIPLPTPLPSVICRSAFRCRRFNCRHCSPRRYRTEVRLGGFGGYRPCARVIYKLRCVH